MSNEEYREHFEKRKESYEKMGSVDEEQSDHRTYTCNDCERSDMGARELADHLTTFPTHSASAE